MWNICFIVSQACLLIAFLVGDIYEIILAKKKQSRFSLSAIIFSTVLHVVNMSLLLAATMWTQNMPVPEWLRPYFVISYVSMLLNIAAVWSPSVGQKVETPSPLRMVVHGLIVVNAVLAFCKIINLF